MNRKFDVEFGTGKSEYAKTHPITILGINGTQRLSFTKEEAAELGEMLLGAARFQDYMDKQDTANACPVRFGKLKLVSKRLPREVIEIVVDATPGTPEWERILRADVVYEKHGNVSYSRECWCW